jgi:antitoxin ParD1/3/4
LAADGAITARTSTLNVSLTPTLEGFVRAKVKSGDYESASEVIRESLRTLHAVERHEQAFWSEVRDKVAFARRDIAQGRVVDGEQAMDEILAETDGTAALKNPGKNGRKRASK